MLEVTQRLPTWGVTCVWDNEQVHIHHQIARRERACPGRSRQPYCEVPEAQQPRLSRELQPWALGRTVSTCCVCHRGLSCLSLHLCPCLCHLWSWWALCYSVLGRMRRDHGLGSICIDGLIVGMDQFVCPCECRIRLATLGKADACGDW